MPYFSIIPKYLNYDNLKPGKDYELITEKSSNCSMSNAAFTVARDIDILLDDYFRVNSIGALGEYEPFKIYNIGIPVGYDYDTINEIKNIRKIKIVKLLSYDEINQLSNNFKFNDIGKLSYEFDRELEVERHYIYDKDNKLNFIRCNPHGTEEIIDVDSDNYKDMFIHTEIPKNSSLEYVVKYQYDENNNLIYVEKLFKSGKFYRVKLV